MKNATIKGIGDFVRMYRDVLGLSTRDLAEQTQVSSTVINSLENYKNSGMYYNNVLQLLNGMGYDLIIVKNCNK